MKNFVPKEKMLNFGGAPIRLIFSDESDFNEEEKKHIKAFKEMCKEMGEPVPDSDPMIL